MEDTDRRESKKWKIFVTPTERPEIEMKLQSRPLNILICKYIL